MSQRVTRSAAAAAGAKRPASEESSPEKKKAPKSKTTPAAKKAKKITPSNENYAENAENVETSVNETVANSIYDFTVNDIKGKPISLDKYKGHVCIIVNVASRCGYTKKNYQELVQLYEKYADDKGLKILAFPCNQFGGQEPGTPEAICKFVSKYNVKFDMFETIQVNGRNADPLYKYLCSELVATEKSKKKGDTDQHKIKWNFSKFIIDINGKPVERFGSSTNPMMLVETLKKYW